MEVTYLGALLAGLVSFLSPCVLPLVPPYLCFLGGTTLDRLIGEDGGGEGVHGRVVLSSLLFVLGFTTVFVSLGATATTFGRLVGDNLGILANIAGVVIIFMGLHFLGLFKIPLLNKEARCYAESKPSGLFGSYLMGLAFAFGWTPCIGPVLAAILFVAAGEETVWKGVSLLSAYSLGLGVPFIAAALAIRPFLNFMQRFRQHLGTVEKVMGGLLVVTGLMFITGTMNTVSFWLLETFPALSEIG